MQLLLLLPLFVVNNPFTAVFVFPLLCSLYCYYYYYSCYLYSGRSLSHKCAVSGGTCSNSDIQWINSNVLNCLLSVCVLMSCGLGAD